MERSQRADFVFTYPLRVRWSEVDPQAIVFNPNYLLYADIALGEYMRALGHAPSIEQIAEIGADVFAVHAELNFYDAAKYDDELTIGARCTYIGRTSFRMLFAIFHDGHLLTEIRTVYVYAELRERRPLPLREDLVASIDAHESIPPQRKT